MGGIVRIKKFGLIHTPHKNFYILVISLESIDYKPKASSSSSSSSNTPDSSSSGGSSEKDFVEKIIKSNKVVIFSKIYCPYCRNVKRILQEMGVHVSFEDIRQRR